MNTKMRFQKEEISRDVEEIGSRDARRSEYFPASVHGEARDSSTVTLIRARFRRRIRGTRVILVPTNPLPASFLSFLSSPVTFPPGMTRSRALDSVPWHYVVPHLLVCGSVTKPPLPLLLSLQILSGNRVFLASCDKGRHVPRNELSRSQAAAISSKRRPLEYITPRAFFYSDDVDRSHAWMD